MGVGNWLVKKLGQYLTKNKSPTRSYLCDFDRICHEVRPADVLLVEGRNRISHIIQKVTMSPWSHAALYIGRLHDIEDPQLRETIHHLYQGPPNDQLIIESIVGKGTFISSIRHYQDDHVRICRPAGLAYRDAQRVIAYATKSVGKHYNLRHFFDLGRFLLRSHFIPARMASSLFTYKPGSAAEDICSAMIAESFSSIQFPVLPLVREDDEKQLELIHRNPRLFAPSDFDYSPYFNIIKYPIFSVSDVAPYKKLPWEEDYVSNDDAGLAKVAEEQPKKEKKKKR